jgi:hypothetical protein
MSFLAQFDALRDARQDIRLRPWSHPGNCIIADKYHRFMRAQEEIERLHVEIPRVRTYIADRLAHMSSTAKKLAEGDYHLQLLAKELQRRVAYKEKINNQILFHISQIDPFPEMPLLHHLGVRLGNMMSNDISSHLSMHELYNEGFNHDSNHSDDSELNNEINWFEELFSAVVATVNYFTY